MALLFSSQSDYSNDILEQSSCFVEDLQEFFELSKCAEWVKAGNYARICLQFPDNLLKHSFEVQKRLQNLTGQKYYILADTAYQSCCIDFTSAEHVEADAVIHYGPACLSKTERKLPNLYIYEKKPLNVLTLYESFQKLGKAGNVHVIFDPAYCHTLSQVQDYFAAQNAPIGCCSSADLQLVPPQCSVALFVGQNSRIALSIKLKLKSEEMYIYDPESDKGIVKLEEHMRVLKLRNFFCEKIKDSQIFGIVVGTLAVENHLKVINRLKELFKLHSKKSYLISVGKPTVAKLGNFLEIDMFVLVGCLQNELYESRDFHKPIVTPFDVENALNSGQSSLDHFSYDFNDYLTDERPQVDQNATDVSLVSGRLRGVDHSAEPSREIATRANAEVAIRSGGDFLSTRSWQGLDPAVGDVEPQLAAEGRKGTPQMYENETF